MVADRSYVARGSLLLLLVGAPACDDAGGAEPEQPAFGELGQLYLEYVNLLNAVDRYFCDCSIADGDYADMRECVAATGGPVIPPVLAECYARVFDAIASDRQHIECQFTEYMKYLDCLELAGCGGDLAGCQQALGAGTCPQLSYAANAALAGECLGYEMPPAFVCGDGAEIVPWYECNFWPDCADGSDEHAGCPEGFKCQSGKTIPKSWTCDGSTDCPDGDDEAGCS